MRKHLEGPLSKHPLLFLLLFALLTRILAAIFSKGYAFHDDHFCVIRVAQNWVYGFPHWLDREHPPLHSMFYTSLHYFLFLGMEKLNLGTPEAKMFVVRLLHGLYSILIVYFSYKITELVSSKKNALFVGLILTFLWFMPSMSVKNLVEMVCIPPILAAFYFILKAEKSGKKLVATMFLAGLLFGIAFSLRYHTVLFAGGLGLVLLFKNQWKESVVFILGFISTAFLFVGLIDVIFYKYPFHSIVEYYTYNSAHSTSYFDLPFYNFLLTLLGFLIPPVSIFLLFGFFRGYKTEPYMFWAAIVFFLFHSMFPNKQERFILPLVPFVVILGMTGWENWITKQAFKDKYTAFFKHSWSFFWAVNLAIMIFMSYSYSKKTRIAPLVYLSEKKDVEAILMDFQHNKSYTPPAFYLGRPASAYSEFSQNADYAYTHYQGGKPLPQSMAMIYSITDQKTLDEVKKEIEEIRKRPRYVIIAGTQKLAERKSTIEQNFGKLEFLTKIAPSVSDKILNVLNPHIYKNTEVFIYHIKSPEIVQSP